MSLLEPDSHFSKLGADRRLIRVLCVGGKGFQESWVFPQYVYPTKVDEGLQELPQPRRHAMEIPIFKNNSVDVRIRSVLCLIQMSILYPKIKAVVIDEVRGVSFLKNLHP
jgi:hypothetical protein